MTTIEVTLIPQISVVIINWLAEAKFLFEVLTGPILDYLHDIGKLGILQKIGILQEAFLYSALVVLEK